MAPLRLQVLRIAALLVCVAGVAPSLQAQPAATDQRDVLAVTQKLFDAMAACDEATIRAVTVPEGRLYRQTVGADTPARSVSLDEFATSFGKCGRKMLERMWEPQVRVHKGIATVWAPYDFWLNGTFSHCGIDSFEFMKTAGGWKLTGGSYTVERDGCAPSPLGPPPASAEAR